MGALLKREACLLCEDKWDIRKVRHGGWSSQLQTNVAEAGIRHVLQNPAQAGLGETPELVGGRFTGGVITTVGRAPKS